MYKQLYAKMIRAAKLEDRRKNLGVYYESHHIVPEFMFKNRKRPGPKGHLDGDANKSDNLVLLTFQEHLMAHYYLYEIYKDTRYGYSTGAALTFFFIKATGGHKRQIELSDVDKQYLDEMAHLRQIGISSISNARKRKMPVVVASTREKVGSVSVDHPNVLLGIWVHHSKGVKQTWKPRCQKGALNSNFREMTNEHIVRVMQCVKLSAHDGVHCSKNLFREFLKNEFTELKKVSLRWVENHLGPFKKIVDRYNSEYNESLIYNPYYRSDIQKKLLSTKSATFRTVTNGITNKRIKLSEIDCFLKDNPTYKRRT
jgi:uncharacterized protein YfeS